MKNILLPTDFSENAYNALHYALQLFENEECTFYLFNTYIPVIFDSSFFTHMPSMDSLDSMYKEKSLKELSKTRDRLKLQFPDSKSKIELQTSFNSLPNGVKEAIKDHNIDLVIMGTQGATGTVGVLFGSNTIQVLKELQCPLIAVPSNYEFKKIEHILFPTDYGLSIKTGHLEWIKYFSNTFNASLKILHVYYYGYDLDTKQQETKEMMNKYFGNINSEFIRLDNMEVVNAIEDFQKKNPVELLALINNKHSFFDNLFFKPVIKHIGFNLMNPLLVIPSKLVSN